MDVFALTVIILNIIASTAIGIFQYRRSRSLALICFFTGILVPVFGPVMCFAMCIRFKDGHHQMAVEETIRSYKIKEAEYVDEQRLRNVVPVDDALSINSESERRAFLLGLLRQKDIHNLAGTLKKALTNEDSEASHYAASAIMELQRNTYSEMMDRQAEYQKAQSPDYDTSIAYAASIMAYLESSEVGSLENFAFRSRYEEVMNYILFNLTEDCTPTDFENMTDMMISKGRLAEADAYASKFGERFPDMESSFICRLRLAYEQRNRTKFSKVMDELTASPIQLSYSGLSMVRFWQLNNQAAKATGKEA